MSQEIFSLEAYLEECREQTLAEILRIVPEDDRRTGGLYRLMLDYPLRPAKGLRPALCIAAARALGAPLAAALPSAAALELYHNAFLIHDDVEDLSETRRARGTLHGEHGVPIAINVGDGMLAICLRPLLGNIEHIGLGRSLRVLDVVATMCRESAEGQMMELSWVGRADSSIGTTDYVRMVHKKTSWYSFIAPVLIGSICAGAGRGTSRALAHFAGLLGIAFQIQDDVLNLGGANEAYGKESFGDLWEGKITLPLLHAIRSATPEDRARALHVLERRRDSGPVASLRHELSEWHQRGELTGSQFAQLQRRLDGCAGGPARTLEDVEFLRGLIEYTGGVAAAWQHAERYCSRAAMALGRAASDLPRSAHTRFLSAVCNYVVQRRR